MAIADHYSFLQLRSIEPVDSNVSNIITLKYVGGTLYMMDDGRNSFHYDTIESTKDDMYYKKFNKNQEMEVLVKIKTLMDMKNDLAELSYKDNKEDKTFTIRIRFLDNKLKKKDRFLIKNLVIETVDKIMDQNDNRDSTINIHREYIQSLNEIRLIRKMENVKKMTTASVKRKL